MIRRVMDRRTATALVVTTVAACMSVVPISDATAGSPLRSASRTFEAGAAQVDITPPRWTASSDALFVPACGPSADQVSQIWSGPRRYQFEEPYVDLDGNGRYSLGDPFCDADLNHRYEAPYIAGGSGENHWPVSTDIGNPIRAVALVLQAGGRRVALVVADSIGLFNVTIARIRAAAMTRVPGLDDVLVSSTHDESAPDPIGLWGPDTSNSPLAAVDSPAPVTSGVDEYYFDFMVDRTAEAVAAAKHHLRSATLKVAEGRQPPNVLSCFSSYPYIDDQVLPVMQAIDRRTGRVIFTLVNAQTHAETLSFSGVDRYTSMFSSDWPGPMRDELARMYPGSIGVEMAGLVGSVETPTVYEPESTRVINVPGVVHDSQDPNPNGCTTVYPDPKSGTAVGDAHEFLGAYGRSMAHAAAKAIEGARSAIPTRLSVARASVCVQVENNLFKAGFAAGLFPDRPVYVEPTCTVGVALEPPTSDRSASAPGAPPSDPVWIKTDVAVLTMPPVQVVWLPGEVFPFTAIRGHIDPAGMPFPTTCYDPAAEDYWCGPLLPMTPWISADMTQPYHFMAGLGEDMIGYLFPPGNFVGDFGETTENPWLAYHVRHGQRGDTDRFGHGHPDDSESVGPYAALAVLDAADHLLAQQGHPSAEIDPGLFVDAAGHLSASPFRGDGFGGAVGVEVLAAGRRKDYRVGSNAARWVTFDGRTDGGTPGTGLPYSVSTAGVRLQDGRVVLVDVFDGAGMLQPRKAAG